MTHDADWLRRTASLVHAQAAGSRARDGMCAETALCFDERGELYLTLLGTGPGISARAAHEHRPARTLVLDERLCDARTQVAGLLAEALPAGRACLAVIYTRGEPDADGPIVRTVAVSPSLDVSHGQVTVLPGAPGHSEDDDGVAAWWWQTLAVEPGPEPMSSG